MSPQPLTLQCPRCNSVFYTLSQSVEPLETCPHCAHAAPRSSYQPVTPHTQEPPQKNKISSRFHPVVPKERPHTNSSPLNSNKRQNPPITKTLRPLAAKKTNIIPQKPTTQPISEVTPADPNWQHSTTITPPSTPEKKHLTPPIQSLSSRKKNSHFWPILLGLTILSIGSYWLLQQNSFLPTFTTTTPATPTPHVTPNPITTPKTEPPAIEIRRATPANPTPEPPPTPTNRPSAFQWNEPSLTNDPFIPTSDQFPTPPTLTIDPSLDDTTATPAPWTSLAFHQIIEQLNHSNDQQTLQPLIHQSKRYQQSILHYLKERQPLCHDQLPPTSSPVQLLSTGKNTFVFTPNCLSDQSTPHALLLFHGDSTKDPQLDWPLFQQSHKQLYQTFLKNPAPPTRPQRFHLLCQLTHQQLPTEILKNYLPLSTQDSANTKPSLLLVARDTPEGRLLESRLQWNQTYLIEASITKVQLPGLPTALPLLSKIRQ